MKSELCPAGKTLMAQINYKWPNRNTSSDNFTNNSIKISEYMFGDDRGKIQAEELADQLNAYHQDGKDNGRLAEASCEDGLHVVFAENTEDDSVFKLAIFDFFEEDVVQPEKTLVMPKYPGKSVVKFGQNNEHVQEIQFHLIEKKFLNDFIPTGEYDDATAAAVKDFYLKYMKEEVDGKSVTEAAWKRILSTPHAAGQEVYGTGY